MRTFGAGAVGEAVARRRGACRPSHAGVSITLALRGAGKEGKREGGGVRRSIGRKKCSAAL